MGFKPYCLHELKKEPISGTSTSNYLEEFPNIELDDLTDNSVFKELPGNGFDELSVKIGISSRDYQSSHFPSTAPCISIGIEIQWLLVEVVDHTYLRSPFITILLALVHL